MESIIGVGIYNKEDYAEILNISEDRDNMDPTWEEWKEGKKKAQRNLDNLGLNTIDIIVRPNQLVAYCRQKNIEIIGSSRAEFISHQARMLSEE